MPSQDQMGRNGQKKLSPLTPTVNPQPGRTGGKSFNLIYLDEPGIEKLFPEYACSLFLDPEKERTLW